MGIAEGTEFIIESGFEFIPILVPRSFKLLPQKLSIAMKQNALVTHWRDTVGFV